MSADHFDNKSREQLEAESLQEGNTFLSAAFVLLTVVIGFGALFWVVTTPQSSQSVASTGTDATKIVGVTDPAPSPKSWGIGDPKPTGLWITRTARSKIDDSQNVYLRLMSFAGLEGKYGSRVSPSLYITCRENTTSLFVDWGAYLGTRNTRVLYRIDKRDAVTDRWGISTDYQAAGLWKGRQSIPLVKKLLDAYTLLIQVTPYGESPQTVDFTVRGLEAAIKPLRKACHW